MEPEKGGILTEKFRLEYKAGSYIHRGFWMPAADATVLYEALNAGATRYSFPLQRALATTPTRSDTVRYRATSVHYQSPDNAVVAISGYANLWGWGYRARQGSEKEANFKRLDAFVRLLGNGFSQVMDGTNRGRYGYVYVHDINDLSSLRVTCSTPATTASLIDLAAIIARTGSCTIYGYEVLDRRIAVENLTRPIELKFLKLQNNQIVGQGAVLCQGGGNREGVVDQLEQLGYDLVAEKAY